MSEQKSVVIKLLGRDFQVACPEDKKDDLFKASEYLNEQMENIDNKNKIIGLEKIAIMAALNISNELMQLKADQFMTQEELSSKLINLQSKLSDALIT